MDEHFRPVRITVSYPLLLQLLDAIRSDDGDGIYLVVCAQKKIVRFGRVQEEDMVEQGAIRRGPENELEEASAKRRLEE